jgi:small basic protein
MASIIALLVGIVIGIVVDAGVVSASGKSLLVLIVEHFTPKK